MLWVIWSHAEALLASGIATRCASRAPGGALAAVSGIPRRKRRLGREDAAWADAADCVGSVKRPEGRSTILSLLGREQVLVDVVLDLAAEFRGLHVRVAEMDPCPD